MNPFHQNSTIACLLVVITGALMEVPNAQIHRITTLCATFLEGKDTTLEFQASTTIGKRSK